MTTIATATTRTVTSSIPGTYIINHTTSRHPDTLHRTDGPARISVYPNGTTDPLIAIWCDHGHHHRLDGPNITLSDGDLHWTAESNDIAQVTEPRGHA